VKRTRDFIESQDKNKVWDYDSMSRNMRTSTAVSRLNTISNNRKEILNKQREVSQAIAQLNTEYNTLMEEFEKRDIQIKKDSKIKKKLEIIKEKRKEQERLIKG
jgi:flagellar biosynthesis component FlhA